MAEEDGSRYRQEGGLRPSLLVRSSIRAVLTRRLVRTLSLPLPCFVSIPSLGPAHGTAPSTRRHGPHMLPCRYTTAQLKVRKLLSTMSTLLYSYISIFYMIFNKICGSNFTCTTCIEVNDWPSNITCEPDALRIRKVLLSPPSFSSFSFSSHF